MSSHVEKPSPAPAPADDDYDPFENVKKWKIQHVQARAQQPQQQKPQQQKPQQQKQQPQKPQQPIEQESTARQPRLDDSAMTDDAAATDIDWCDESDTECVPDVCPLPSHTLSTRVCVLTVVCTQVELCIPLGDHEEHLLVPSVCSFSLPLSPPTHTCVRHAS